jgi:hypothetical protein
MRYTNNRSEDWKVKDLGFANEDLQSEMAELLVFGSAELWRRLSPSL